MSGERGLCHNDGELILLNSSLSANSTFQPGHECRVFFAPVRRDFDTHIHATQTGF